MTDTGQGHTSPSRTWRASTLKVLAVVATVTLALVVTYAVYRTSQSGAPRPYPEPQVPLADRTPPAAGTLRPESFGAVGDGVTDDSAALQATLDAAAGQTVTLAPDATYLLDRPLLLPSHTTLIGPRSAVLQFTWATNSDERPFHIGNADQAGGNSDIVLEGFTIRGGGEGVPYGPNLEGKNWAVPAVRLRHVNTFTLRDLDIGFAPGIAVLYQASAHGVIERNHVHDSGRDGVTGTWLEGDLVDVTVADNVIERFGDDAIAVAGATVRSFNSTALPADISIVRNRIEGWEEDPNGQAIGRGIALLAVTRVQVQDNRISRTAGPAILLRGAPTDDSVNPLTGEPWYSSDVTIRDNDIRDAGSLSLTSVLPGNFSGGNGLDISRSELVVARDNSIEVAAGDRVAVDDCDDCVIEAD